MASTAIAADSRQMPSRRVEMTADRATPATIPTIALSPSDRANSPTGAPSEWLPDTTEVGQRDGEHRAGRVVERGFGDHRLGDLRRGPAG